MVVFPHVPKNYPRLFQDEAAFVEGVRIDIFRCSDIIETGVIMDDPDNPSFDDKSLGIYAIVSGNKC
jgi:hypothetical protein